MLTSPSTLLLVLALAITIVSFIPRLTIPWQVPVLLVIVALLAP